MKRINTITLRDLDERADELRDERAALEEAVEEATDAENAEDLASAEKALSQWEEENLSELEELESIIEDCSGGDGLDTLLIHEAYFVDYVEEMCEDIGDLPRDFPSYIVIDWEATADNIKADYSEVEYDGATYYYRNY